MLDKKNILHEELCNEQSEGWKFVNRSEHTEVWRKADPTKPVHLVKVSSSLVLLEPLIKDIPN